MFRTTQRARRAGMLRAAVAALALLSFAQVSQALTWTPATSADLTTALSGCALGDTIILTAGTVYTPSSGGGFLLTDKGAGTSYITIKSSALASLPTAGVRVATTDATNMPKLQALSGSASNYALNTSGAAHHYKVIGVEFLSMSSNADQTAVIQLGQNDSTQTSLTQCPHDLIFDRCLVHTNASTQTTRRGFAVNSGLVEIINSRIYDFKEPVTTSSDSQAIAIWNGPGPFTVSNCYLESASETILVGGSPLKIPNVIPSNLTVTRSHLNKPLAWQTQSWNVKNLFELKAGKHVSLDGNRLENCWNQAGSFFGTAISIKRIAQPDQGNTWTETDDVQLNNNVVSNVGLGIALSGSTEDHFDVNGNTVWTTIGWPKNVTLHNNLFDKITGPDTWTGNKAHFIDHGSGDVNSHIDHNSVFGAFITTNSSRILDMINSNSGPYAGYVFSNNIVQRGQYGFKNPTGDDELCFDNRFTTPVYKKNVTKGMASSSMLPNYPGDWDLSPFLNTGLAFPASLSTVLVNPTTPGTDYAGYKVLGWDQATNFTTYPYHNSGTDGKDIGVDIVYLNSCTANCAGGVWTDAAGDSIEYTGTLVGGSDGFGFGTNAWGLSSGSTNPAISTGSMTYTDGTRSITTKGNKIEPVVNSHAYRNFPSTIVTAGQTIWVSFRINNTGTGTLPTNHAGFQLSDGLNGAATNYLFLGKPGFGATNWGVDHNGTVVQKAGAVTTADRNAFLVYKLVFSGTQVTVSMWVNPPLTEVALPAPAFVTSFAHNANIASMFAGTGTNAAGYQLDEFRMSPVFTDVAK